MDGVKVLIINGAECEPFITSDHRTMLEDAQNVIDGALAVMKYLELDECYIGIEDNKQDAIDNFNKLFSGQGISNMHTFPLKASYPKGAERVLIYEVTGKTCNAGVLPADLGCIDHEKCKRCGMCVVKCPTGAIQDLLHTPEQLEKIKKSVAAMEAKEAEKRKQAALEAAAAKKAAAEKAAAEKA